MIYSKVLVRIIEKTGGKNKVQSRLNAIAKWLFNEALRDYDKASIEKLYIIHPVK